MNLIAMAVRLGTAPARKGTSAPHLLAGSEDHFLGLRDLRETAALLLSTSDSMRKIHQVISSVFFWTPEKREPDKQN